MTCPVCNRDDNVYLRCNRPDCTDGRHVPTATASIPAPVVTVEMLAAFERQSDNMAFVLNHVTLPSQWCDKFTLELEQDRAAIAQMKEKP